MSEPRPLIPGLADETQVALLGIIDGLKARLAVLEQGPTSPPVIEDDFTAQVGQYVRLRAPPAGLRLSLPKPQPANRGKSITLAFESTGPVTIQALDGTVNGNVYVTNSLVGTFDATSNGADNWAVVLGLGTTGLPASTGAQGLRGATGATGSMGGRGRVGDDGLRGFPGPQGLIGPIGPMGFSAQDGADGNDGLPGATGLQGFTGTGGLHGQDGADGADGNPGLPGATGPSNGVPASFPPVTFFGNDTATAAQGSAQSLGNLAGDGLRFEVSMRTSPAPTVLTLASNEADQAVNAASINVALPTSRAVGDRLILLVAALAGVVSTPAGWTDLSGAFTTNDHHVFERVLDGTEANTVAVVSTLSGDLVVHQIAIRGSDPATASIASGNTGATPTTIDAPAVTATWGAVNNLFIGATLWLFNPTITGFPPELSATGQFTFGSQTIGYGFFAATSNTASLDPGLWTVGTSARPTAFTLVVSPLPIGAFSVSPSVRGLVLGAQDGADGNDGLPGATGLQGVQGVQGFPGNDGRDGADGNDGLPGAIGAQGAQGVQGAQGLPGADGQDGDQGIQGFQGQPGNDGAVGPQGASLVFFGADGADGDQGMIGLPGATGNDGAVGPQGASLVLFGADGADGDQGPMGLPGAPGATGNDGAVGPQGASLVIFGADGNDGDQGMIGPQGAQGVQGTQGPAGQSVVLFGADGRDGEDGVGLLQPRIPLAATWLGADITTPITVSDLRSVLSKDGFNTRISGTNSGSSPPFGGSLAWDFRKDPVNHFFFEDFGFVQAASVTAPIAPGTILDCGTSTWGLLSTVSAGRVLQSAGDPSHPGSVNLLTDVLLGHGVLMFLGAGDSATSACIEYDDILALEFIVFISGTNASFVCGFSTDWTNCSTALADGVYVDFNTVFSGAGNIIARQSKGGASVASAATAYTAGSAYIRVRLEFSATIAGKVNLFINGTSVGNCTFGTMLGTFLNFGFGLFTRTNATASVYVDFCMYETRTLAR